VASHVTLSSTVSTSTVYPHHLVLPVFSPCLPPCTPISKASLGCRQRSWRRCKGSFLPARKPVCICRQPTWARVDGPWLGLSICVALVAGPAHVCRPSQPAISPVSRPFSHLLDRWVFSLRGLRCYSHPVCALAKGLCPLLFSLVNFLNFLNCLKYFC